MPQQTLYNIVEASDTWFSFNNYLTHDGHLQDWIQIEAILFKLFTFRNYVVDVYNRQVMTRTKSMQAKKMTVKIEGKNYQQQKCRNK